MFTSFLTFSVNPLNAELNPTCHLLALLGAHPILYISRIRVNSVGLCNGYWTLALPACYSLTVPQPWHFSFFVLSVSIQNNSTPVIQHLEGFFRQGEKKLRNWSLFVMWLQFVWMWSDMISDICIFLFYHVLLAHKTKNIYFPDCL